MLRFSSVPRVVYLLLIIIVFAIILTIASANLLRQENVVLTEAEPGQEEVAAAGALPALQKEENGPGQPDLSQEEAGASDSLSEPRPDEADLAAQGLDHHGNPRSSLADPVYEKAVGEGVAVEFTVENYLGVGGRGGEIASEIFEGEYALLKFRISDPDTDQALPDLRPAAWMDFREKSAVGEGGNTLSCEKKVQSYLGGTLTARPDINLNSYFVLALNDQGTISVIDPMIDVGGMTNLFALMYLSGPGQDWVMSGDQQRLFVSVPSTGQVAVADLEKFEVLDHLDVGDNPVRITLPPDERYLWVGNDADQAGESGVTVIDPVGLAVVTRIPTGAGGHELAFSAGGNFLFVTNSSAGTLSIIDARKLRVVKDIPIGEQPAAVARSEVSQAIYVANAGDGTIAVVDGEGGNIIAEINAAPGLNALRFAPGGRWGLVTNPQAGQVYVLDAASNRISYVLPVEGEPDQISFSKTAAYIRLRGAPAVAGLQLADLGQGEALPLVTLPVGQAAPGAFPALALADAMFATPDDGALVMANPADDQIYYYVEGAQAPLGSFQGHGLLPRAVQVVDRSLREVVPGVYTSQVRVPKSGEYEVAFMLDSPGIVHCFAMTVEPNPGLAQNQGAVPPQMDILTEAREATVGEPYSLQIRLTDPATNEPLRVEDLYALADQTAGNWNQRFMAKSLGEGLYEININLPKPGLYNIFFAVPSLWLNFDQLPFLYLEATAAD